jgi:uncharacterized Ntn-hydrolase superfamily protein
VTYSIVARDPATGSMGVAVQSHFFGVGRLVTWASPGVGVVATQAMVERSYGPRGLEVMEHGRSAPEALTALLAEDPDREIRQVAMIDAAGRIGVHTGQSCVAAAGGAVGNQVAAVGNMLAGPSCWNQMLAAFEHTAGSLTDRMLAALDAGEAAGGDLRGRQSAALLVVEGTPTARPWEGVIADVRVDDDPDPLRQLRRLARFEDAYRILGRALFEPADGADLEIALEGLDTAQQILGANPEPTVWRGVLLARAGRLNDARQAFEAATKQRPQLVEFIRRLPAAGLLPADWAV